LINDLELAIQGLLKNDHNDRSYHECISLVEEAVFDPVLEDEISHFERPRVSFRDLLQVPLHRLQYLVNLVDLILVVVQIFLLLIYIPLLYILKEENLLFHVEKCCNSSFSDRELRRKLPYMIKFKLPVDFFGYLWHVLEVVQTPKALYDLLQVTAIIKEIL